MRQSRVQSQTQMRTRGRARPAFNQPNQVAAIKPVPESTGRPPVYDAVRYPHIAETLCREYGMTCEQLAPIFGVKRKTVEQWSWLYPEFKAALKAGRDQFDGAKVENALLKRALGYEYEEKSVETVSVKAKHKIDGYEIRIPAVKTTITTKALPADVRAIMFWLTNRQQDRWKMVTTVNATINSKTEHTKKTLNVTADLSTMNSAQLKELRNIITGLPQNQNQEVEADSNTPLIEYMKQAQDIQEADYTNMEED